MQQTEFQEGIYAEILKTISLKQVRNIWCLMLQIWKLSKFGGKPKSLVG